MGGGRLPVVCSGLYTIYPDFKDSNLWHDSWTGFICNDKFNGKLGYIAIFFSRKKGHCKYRESFATRNVDGRVHKLRNGFCQNC